MNYITSILFIFNLLISSPAFSDEKVRIVFSERINTSAHFFIDEVERIYKKIGLDPIISILPVARIDHLFNVHKVDALGAKILEYEKTHPDAIRINVPLLENFKFKAFVLKEELERVKKLKIPFVVTGSGCTGCMEYARIYNKKISAYYDTLDMSLKLLVLKRADIIIAPSLIIESLPQSRFIKLDNNVFKSTYYHFISKRKAHLKESLEKEFLKSKKRGIFDPKKIIKSVK